MRRCKFAGASKKNRIRLNVFCYYIQNNVNYRIPQFQHRIDRCHKRDLCVEHTLLKEIYSTEYR
jgi:hypothetical protein